MARRSCSLATLVLLLSGAAPVNPVGAAESVNYTYDARGRLVNVDRTGTVNNDVHSQYSYDRADNRTNVTVSGTTSPAPPSFAISNASATEGGTVVFHVTKSGATSSSFSFSVSFASSNGTATAGSDYTAVANTLTFAPADADLTISVPTTDDTAVEGAETFAVTLSGATGGAAITTAQATGTISDNDAAETPPGFAIGNASVTEGGNLILTVTKTGTVTSGYSVNYATANGTATAGSDYTAATGTLTFAAADASKTVTVATIDDTAVESAETVFVNLSGATGGATIATAQGTGTINDNDVANPSFSVSNASGSEGGTLTFTITRSGSTSASVSVSYATANGTATSTGDYVAASGTLTFAIGETTKTVMISTRNNTTVESNEVFYLNLSSPTGGATITDSQGVGTIYDDDDSGGGPGGGGCPTVC